MKCTNCNTENSANAKFCRNCGNPLLIYPSNIKSNDESVNQLLIVLAVNLFISICWFIVNLFSYWSEITNIVLGSIGLITTIIIGIIIKNRNAKILLIISFILELIFFIYYRFLN